MCLQDTTAVEKLFCISSDSLTPVLYSLSVRCTRFIVFISVENRAFFFFFFYVLILCYLSIYLQWVAAHYLLSAMGIWVELMRSNMFVWVYANVLLGKQNLLAPLFLPGIQRTSPCQVGQAGVRVSPWGEAEASGCATIRLSSVALLMLWVMHRSDRVISFLHLSSPPFIQTLFQPPPHPPKWKAIGLFTYCQWSLLLFLEQDENGWSQGERPHCLRSWQTARAGSFTHLLLEIIFWHLFIDPLKMRMNLEKPFSQSCECSGKGKKKAKLLQNEAWSLKKETCTVFSVFSMCCSIHISTASFKVFPLNWAVSSLLQRGVRLQLLKWNSAP